MAQAMDDVAHGALYCLDQNPQISNDVWNRIRHRTTLFIGRSPEELPKLYARAGGPFDVALIDGDHRTSGVLKDIAGVLAVLRLGGYMIFHDAHYEPVAIAIHEALALNGGHLVDVGMIVEGRTADRENPSVSWGGLQVLRRVG
jgi:predicted O-methyltransferase YrrM